MGKRIPVPPELQHLIEKREGEQDRRQGDQRDDADRRGEDDLGPLGAIESAKNVEDVPSDERRSNQARRQEKERRRRSRRKADS